MSALSLGIGGLALAVGVASRPVPAGALDGRVAPLPPDGSATIGEHALCEIESRLREPNSIQPTGGRPGPAALAFKDG